MQYALNDSGRKIEAEPGLGATCQGCSEQVLAKCGQQKVWHWSHLTHSDCDSWWEPESDWHRKWKACFPPEYREVVMGDHRADVALDPGRVIELQHSAISMLEAGSRETFYGRDNMLWLVDASNFRIELRRNLGGGRYTFRWKWPRRVWVTRTAPVFLHRPNDRHNRLMWLERAYNNKYVGGILRKCNETTPSKMLCYPECETAIKALTEDRNQ